MKKRKDLEWERRNRRKKEEFSALNWDPLDFVLKEEAVNESFLVFMKKDYIALQQTPCHCTCFALKHCLKQCLSYLSKCFSARVHGWEETEDNNSKSCSWFAAESKFLLDEITKMKCS